MTETATTYRVARLGNGIALHLADEHGGVLGILCNRWGTVNGVWKPVKVVAGLEWTDATCKRCHKIRQAAAVAR